MFCLHSILIQYAYRCSRRPEKDRRFPLPGVVGGCEPCEPSYRFWEVNVGPLQEQYVLQNAEQSL